jgi:curli biogenesis system outer membrane secretion channel CsgG
VVCFGCTTGKVVSQGGPSVSEAQGMSATGPRARIAVGQFINNTGGMETQLQRLAVQTQATMANLGRDMMEFQKQMIPYQQELTEWQMKVQQYGREKAGPMPKAPDFSSSSSSGYTTMVIDPVAGGIRDMLINMLFNSRKYILVERPALNAVDFEQEFSRSSRVGDSTRIPFGEIEGAELLLIGSLTSLNAKASGGGMGAMLSTLASNLSGSDLGNTDVGVSWNSAKASMEIRLIDIRTSRVVAAATVEGKARSVGARGTTYGKNHSSWDPGPLPASFEAYKNTPVESAFRKMVHSAVDYLIKNTPDNYYHR